jgi:hypothetical protein
MTRAAQIARIRRALAREGEHIIASRSRQERAEFGDFVVRDAHGVVCSVFDLDELEAQLIDAEART